MSGDNLKKQDKSSHLYTMKNVCAYLLLLLLINSIGRLNAQDVGHLKLKLGNKSYDYCEMQPAGPVKGILILLPAFGEKPKSIFTKTALPKQAATYGYVTLIPDVPMQMFATEECINELNALVEAKTKQYNLSYGDIVIGGLSDGGAIALCYTEYLNSKPEPIKLKAVFAIDPPADMARIYTSGEQEIGYDCPLISREGRNGINNLNNLLGGSPAASPDAYYRLSAFSASAANGGNARFLKDIPVRLYAEPDLAYVQKTYCSSLQFINLNAYDLEKLIVFLKGTGNQRSAYIKTMGRGFHSWNIVEPEDFAVWITSL